MQLLLPIFPKEAKLITPSLAVYEQEGEVYYSLSGMPIFTHESKDHRQFCYITSNLVHRGRCRQVDIINTFHVSPDSVRRYLRKFEQEGMQGFVEKDGRHGRSYKMTPERLGRIQKRLNKGGERQFRRQTGRCFGREHLVYAQAGKTDLIDHPLPEYFDQGSRF